MINGPLIVGELVSINESHAIYAVYNQALGAERRRMWTIAVFGILLFSAISFGLGIQLGRDSKCSDLITPDLTRPLAVPSPRLVPQPPVRQ